MLENLTQERLYLLDKASFKVIHNNLTDRNFFAIYHSSICPISFDGSVLDYHGING